MSKVSFPFVEGVDVDDSMEGSNVSSLGALETLIERDVDEVDPFMSCDKEVGFPLKGRQESLDSILINSKETKEDIYGNDVGPLMIGKEEVESVASLFLDNDEERSLSILSLGEQQVKSFFDEKEDEVKDGLLCLFDDEEGFR